ncbi:hypothetical protein M0811_07217 [Anaeramoeba ignava]|uniref:Uncharacterized protein n=1 Tax=Anaeramoeba ignava TaxID=1746090 RepID=A0A9Q0LMJ8_ANAIG|nr:hypothetical protein M0811_07217 [Anaeramoeba ignava]
MWNSMIKKLWKKQTILFKTCKNSVFNLSTIYTTTLFFLFFNSLHSENCINSSKIGMIKIEVRNDYGYFFADDYDYDYVYDELVVLFHKTKLNSFAISFIIFLFKKIQKIQNEKFKFKFKFKFKPFNTKIT